MRPAAGSSPDWSPGPGWSCAPSPASHAAQPGRITLLEYLLGVGVLLVTGTALTSLILGNALLEHHTWKVELGPLGTAKTTSALVFDTGIYLIVVGVIATLVATLVSESDTEDEAPEVGT